ncbi:hypothetical protein Sa4125_08190 [Aureimonas sp. SA4125]|uniref:hypothetical protein n=1 Tax=Aureimonas sp. SA4125 TaxID=2826993 RepID=UPI001CC7DC83|nr:hypothetical protein [Aureimonas sp. SA4125]BDA83277.1 hypothetical protein Sa4125_08190 [Aureimonas sp. SA4125]
MHLNRAPLRDDRRLRAVPLLWVLASLCLLQWGLSVGPIGGLERQAAVARQAANSLGSSAPRLRDLAKLGGTDLRAKDGKQQAAPAGGDPAVSADAVAFVSLHAGRETPALAASAGLRGIAGLNFRARAPPRLSA